MEAGHEQQIYQDLDVGNNGACHLGLAVGPNYKRPLVAVPTIGDEQWVKIFEDATLQRLVQEALQNNLDVRIAAQRVLEAQAQVGITRSQQLPSVTGGANYSALQIPSSLAGKNTSCAAFEVGYESASQFNREYSRFFGQPPKRDIRTLRSPGARPMESVSNLQNVI